MTTMKLRVTTAVLATGFMAAVGFGPTWTFADTTGTDANPYAVISDRNVFHLNPPPPPPAAPEKAADVPKVLLSGFRTVGSNTRVFMVLQPKDARDVVKFLDLAPGERNGAVELVRINAEKREVDIINSGTHMTLSLASNGVVAMSAPASASAGAHAAGGPPMPGGPGSRRASLPMLPQAAPPSATAVPPQAGGGNSAIIIGGGESTGGPIVAGGGSANTSGFGSYNSPTISGGNPATAMPIPVAGVGNETGVQIANGLMNPSSQYRMPVPPAPATPAEQAAHLIVNAAAGGPPAPPGVEDGPPAPGQ
jgi:hypothetical protein